ncbi:MAG: hypothetical protein KME64_21845 [Scytonematopsis contorta HA4267-MV1]|jgi:hypothetical protein|nr:hypothetical protein [Scytonematopsis contorta HA4267-MV1]
MANFVVSDIPVGLELLNDSETFLDDLNQESENLVVGGHCAPSPLTPRVRCAAPTWEPPIETEPLPKPFPKPKPRPKPPITTYAVNYDVH